MLVKPQSVTKAQPVISKKSMVTAVLLSSLCAVAHAEGNHDLHGIVAVLACLLIVAVVLLGQAIYLLCLRNIAGGLKFTLFIALAVIDLIPTTFLISALDQGDFISDYPFLILLLVVPGFIFVNFAKKNFNRAPPFGSATGK